MPRVAGANGVRRRGPAPAGHVWVDGAWVSMDRLASSSQMAVSLSQQAEREDAFGAPGNSAQFDFNNEAPVAPATRGIGEGSSWSGPCKRANPPPSSRRFCAHRSPGC